MRVLGLLCLLSLASAGLAAAQNWGLAEGRVTDAATGTPLARVTVLIDGTNFGTATDAEGRYRLDAPAGRYVLRFSLVGYGTHFEPVDLDARRPQRRDVALAEDRLTLDSVVVEGHRARMAPGLYTIAPRHLARQPAPLPDGFRILKTLPGVASNNELSSEYSVRGGGYNENLVFINGVEVFKSFRLRKGEQEGLGLINPDLIEALTLYTGAFPVRYGGKLSSVLEARYRQPVGEALHGAATASLLDQGVAASASAFGGRLSYAAGLRRADPGRFYNTQQRKGRYVPRFADAQAAATLRLAEGHALDAFALVLSHRFGLAPSHQETDFGIAPAEAFRGFLVFQGEEQDRYRTHVGSVRLRSRFGRLRAEHAVAAFETVEEERLDLRAVGVIFELDVDTETGAVRRGRPVASFFQREAFDNRVAVRTATGQGRYAAAARRHAVEAGWYVRRLAFGDRLAERSLAESLDDSSGVPFLDAPDRYVFPVADSVVVHDYRGAAELATAQAGAYVQDVIDLLPARDRLLLTAGLRADYFDLNGQWTLSPRLALRFRASPLLTLSASWGLYHQAPTYRELRGAPEPGQPLVAALNRALKSQQARHVTAGAEYFRPGNRLYFRGEAFYKHLTQLVTYDVEGLQVAYSGENDAEGHAYGVDLQVQGEFVPGFESWFSYGYLVARERFLPGFQTPQAPGWTPRPMDQRHTAALYLQDYFPRNPTVKLHLRILYGSGFPYTPPRQGTTDDGLTTQQPGPRNAGRLFRFFRLDTGAAKILTFAEGRARPLRLQLTAELLNVFDATNTVRYHWVPTAEGRWFRLPTRLTPRTFNVRVRLEF